MDFLDLFRNFLGINHRNDSTPNRRNYQDNESHRQSNNDNRSFGGGENQNDRDDLVVGDMLNSAEEMFQEMERAMRDLESFIGFGGMSPFRGLHRDDQSLPSLPPPRDRYQDDANVRSLVLKEPEKVPAIIDKSDKMDTDLDDLYSKSVLPLSKIPQPPPEPEDEKRFDCPPKIWNSFEKVYSTLDFKNGRWEGKTVRETNKGKEITTYIKDASGEREETREFIPNASYNPTDDTIIPAKNEEQLRTFNPYQIFERLFKPRM